MAAAVVAFALAAPAWAGYRAVVLADGPAAYWQLNEASGTSAADETANGNAATYLNGVTLGVGGALNNTTTAVSLDGTNDYIRASNAASLSPTSALTLEAWVKPTSGAFSTIKPVFAKGFTSHSPPYYQYALGLADTGTYPKYIQFSLSIGGTRHDLNVTNSGWQYGVWNHIVATYNGAAMRVYLNGSEVGSRAQTGALATYATPLAMGCFENLTKSSTYCFQGALDELAVYPAALSATQVSAHYQEASSGSSLPVNTSPPTIFGTTTEGWTLSATNGTWQNDPTAFSYQWRRCDSSGGGCADIFGAVAHIYTPTREDVGFTLRARVEAENAAGTATADSAATATIAGRELAGPPFFKDQLLATSPDHYWGLGEVMGAAVDHAGSSDGAYKDSTTAPVLARGVGGPAIPGRWDEALQVRGSMNVPDVPGYVEMPANDWGMGGQQSFTANMWLRWEGPRLLSVNEVHQGLIGNLNFSNYDGGWGVYVTANTWKLAFRRNTTGSSALESTEKLPVGEWTMVTVTYDGWTQKIFANGELVGSSVNTASLAGGWENLYIGRQDFNLWLSGYWGSFRGTIDEPAVWRRALSDAEVAGLYIPPLDVPAAQTLGATDGCTDFACDRSASLAEPVNTATGSFWTSATDLTLPGIGVSFASTRTYNSADLSSGPLGPGWSTNLAQALTSRPDGNVVAVGEDGQELVFIEQPDGALEADEGGRSELSPIPGGHELVQHDQSRLRFDSSGALTSHLDRNGQGLTFTYANGRLASVTDSAGRLITFTYNTAGLLTRIDVPDGRSVSYGYTDGRLTSVTDVRGKTTTYEYDADGRLWRETDPRGNYVVRNTYGADGRVTEQRDALGNLTTFAWDPATQTSTMTDPAGKTWQDVYANNVLKKRIDPLGNTTAYEYDADLNIVTVTDPRGNATRMTHDGRGNMLTRTAPSPLSYQESWAFNARNDVTATTDARGNTTGYEYDAAGNLIRKTEPGNTVTEYGRDAAGKGLLTSLTDPRGKTTTFTYNALNLLTESTTPLGKATSVGYDAAGRVTSVVEPRGNEPGANPADYTTSFTFDAAGHRLTKTDALGNTTTFTYDDNGNLASVTNAKGKAWTYAYNATNERTSETAPDDSVVAMGYDARGNVASTTSALGDVTSFAYDAANRQIKRVDPRGNEQGADPAQFTWTFAYDPVGNRASVADPLGNTSTYAYDELNRLGTSTNARGKVTSYAYDANGNTTSVTDANGHTRSFAFDALNRLLSASDGRGKSATYAYDENGNRTSATTELGHKTTYAYDDDGRLLARVEPRGNAPGATPSDYETTFTYDAAGLTLSESDPLGNTTAYAYDRAGRLLSRTDANEHTVAWTYDELGRLAKVTAPDLSETAYGYDQVNNLTSRTDARAHTTTYGYDLDHRLTSVTNALGKAWTYAYDANGNLVERVDAKANAAGNPALGTTTYGYDRANRLSGIDYSDATPDVSFSYDAAGNRTQMTDGAGTETYAWDDADNLLAVSRGTQSFSYTYDAADNLTQRTYPDGTTIASTYDDDERLAAVSTGGQTTTYGYDAAGNLTTTTLPSGNGYREQRTYDRAGRLSAVENERAGAVLSSFAIARDGVGNPTQVVTNAGTETYAYDARDRLTQVCYQASCPLPVDPFIRWTYDEVGNRKTETRPLGTTTYTYNAGDQLTSQSGLLGSVSSSYDDNGNQTAAGSRSFTWTMDGRVASTTSGLATTTFAYDGEGKRLQAVSGPTTTNFLWDRNAPLPQLALELDGQNQLLRRYVFGHDTISLTTPAGASYYHHDGLGSVAHVTDAAGASQWTYAYEPFGATRTETQNSLLAPTNPLRFTGEYRDADSNHLHLRARQYDPTSGRFLSTDPVTPPLDDPYVSAYLYASQRPTLLIDPSGEWPWDPAKGFVTGAGKGLYTIGKGLVSAAAHPGETRDAIFTGIYALEQAYGEGGGSWNGAWNATRKTYAWLAEEAEKCGAAFAAGNSHTVGRWCMKALVGMIGIGKAGKLGRLGDDVSDAAKAGAPAKRTTGTTVLGHHPGYVQLSEKLGARRFDIPQDVWARMSDAERWAANQRFLDRTIARGDDIVLATPVDRVRAGSFFERELRYLISQGYRPDAAGTRLLAPGG